MGVKVRVCFMKLYPKLLCVVYIRVLINGFGDEIPANVLLAEDEQELRDHGGDVAGGVRQQAHLDSIVVFLL